MFFEYKQERILNWREFRLQLKNWPESIDTVAQIWSKAPITNNYLVYDDPKHWPDAWQLINDGIFCDISIALGMFYTLYYSSYEEKDKMTIEHYQLPQKHQTLNLVNLEHGKYMLNYHIGRAVNIHTLDISDPIYTITAKDLPIK
jgi:hypothetical protein